MALTTSALAQTPAAPSTLGIGLLPYNATMAARAAAEIHKYTRAELARYMGVSRTMVCRIVGGYRMPSTETMGRLCLATKIPMESLMSYFLMRRSDRLTGNTN